MRDFHFTGRNGDFLKLLILDALPAVIGDDDLTDLEVAVSCGSWKGALIDLYASTKKLADFLAGLEVLKRNPAHATSLQDQDAMIGLRFAGDGQGEVWIYGHVTDLDHRTKLSFSFDLDYADFVRSLG